MASIILNLVVTGQKIIEATEEVAGNDFITEEDLVDGRNVKRIGQTSGYPYEQLLISGNRKDFIDPDLLYTSVRISSHSWPGSVYAIGYSHSDVNDAVRKFASKLQEALLPRLAMEVCRFSFNGKEYFCRLEDASHLGRVVLPDGVVLEVGDWSDTVPPTPKLIREITRIPIATAID